MNHALDYIDKLELVYLPKRKYCVYPRMVYRQKWGKVGKCSEKWLKWGKVVKSWKKLEKVLKSGKKWGKLVKSG